MSSSWYQDAILYEVDVRAFCDSNADGIGDVPGLTEKLHYLRELGVTAIVVGSQQHSRDDWTTAGPSRPDPQNFDRFVREAHARRMHVIVEQPLPQLSDQTLDASLNARAAFGRTIRHWLDAGVDSVKIDTAPSPVDVERTGCVTLPGVHAILKDARNLIDNHYAERIIGVGSNRSPQSVTSYVGHGTPCHMAFNACITPPLLLALRKENRIPLLQALRRTTDNPASCQWAILLRDHDELSLQSCTDSERDEMYETYAPEPRMRFNTGIRRRLAPLFDNNRRRIELAYALLFSLPGSPVIYYGDEIGMGDNAYLDDCNGLRTPMQWSNDRNAGFSRADPARLTVPVNSGPIYGYQVVNVEAQKRQPFSLLNWMRRLTAVRRHHAAFGHGTIEFLEPRNETILTYLRHHRDEEILVVANLSGEAQSVDLALGLYAGAQPLELIGGTRFRRVGAGPYSLTLGPYGFFWLLLSRRVTRASPSSDVVAGVFGTKPEEREAPAALAGSVAARRRVQEH